jgi:hypothetical protein
MRLATMFDAPADTSGSHSCSTGVDALAWLFSEITLLHVCETATCKGI